MKLWSLYYSPLARKTLVTTFEDLQNPTPKFQEITFLVLVNYYYKSNEPKIKIKTNPTTKPTHTPDPTQSQAQNIKAHPKVKPGKPPPKPLSRPLFTFHHCKRKPPYQTWFCPSPLAPGHHHPYPFPITHPKVI